MIKSKFNSFLRKIIFRKSKNSLESLSFLTKDRQGNVWYAFKDPLQMSITRKLQLDDAQEYLSMNITKGRLRGLLQQAVSLANEGKIVELFAILQELLLRLDLLGNKEAYIHLCSLLYIIEGEDPKSLDPYIIEEKKGIIYQDIALQDFFLQHYLQHYRNFTIDLVQDMQSYLNKTQKLTDYLDRHLSKPYLNAVSTSSAIITGLPTETSAASKS